MNKHYDYAVVGNGMIGAAAARYLSTTGASVAAVGPGEPVDWANHSGVFASHYDQGRITRITDGDPVWALLAARSIATYGEIEQQSGITFHGRVGCLTVTPDADAPGDRLNQAEQVGRELGAVYSRLEQGALSTSFPYLRFPSGAVGLWERGDAGYVNPRALVQAQLTVASQQGAQVIAETVVALAPTANGFVLTTDLGNQVPASKVLIATGGYTNHLLGRALALRPLARSVVLAQVDPAEQERLAGLPSLIWRLADHPLLASVYSNPPIRYPDGKHYIKIGGTHKVPPLLTTPAEFRRHFQSAGDPAENAALRATLLDLLPGLQVASWQSKPCVVTYTAHDRPYVDQLAEQLYLAVGGCGAAAKSSNEIGRMGALLAAHGQWTYDLPAATFAVHYAENNAHSLGGG